MNEYLCSNCGETTTRYSKACPHCGQLDTLHRIKQDTSPVDMGAPHSYTPTVTPIISTTTQDDYILHHTPTGSDELDRVLGGGLTDSHVVLLGARPGFGKSTLALQTLAHCAKLGYKALYASGEESQGQILERARRIKATHDNLTILSTTHAEDVLYYAEKTQTDIVCVDSLQTMTMNNIKGDIGGLAQSKGVTYLFKDYAKNTGVPFILISQYTKDNDIAGSNQIPHIVDTVLTGSSDESSELKFLRATKNRYGTTPMTGIFTHTATGLIDVTNPSEYLTGGTDTSLAGSAVTIINDGGQLLPVEINALVTSSEYSNPQRSFTGLNFNRGKILTARLSATNPYMKLSDYDIFLGTAGGIMVDDTMSDVAILASISSARLNIPIADKTLWIGEVSLTGQVRGRTMIEERVTEALRLGYTRIAVPRESYNLAYKVVTQHSNNTIQLITLSNVTDIDKNLA